MKHFNFIILLTTVSLWAASGKMKAENLIPSGNFVSATKKTDLSPSAFQSYALMFGQHKIAKQLVYGVRSYTLVYETLWKGKLIQVSGLVLIPTGTTTTALSSHNLGRKKRSSSDLFFR